MLLYQTGQERAFAILYQRYSSRVYGFLRKRLSDQNSIEDVFQAVFVKLHRSREQFNTSFTFAPWLFTIARTVALDWHKKQVVETKYVPRSEVELEALESPTSGTAELGLIDLSVLPRTQKSAVEMRYMKDMSFDDIARRLDTTPDNVRQLVSRGLKQLRSLFAKAGG